MTTTAPDTQPAGTQAADWRQLLLTTDQPALFETLLIELAPLLHAVGQHGSGCWWIRKGDTLRLRLLRPDPDDVDQITAAARRRGAQIHPGTRLADDILLDHAPADNADTAGLAESLASGPSWQQWTELTFGMTPNSVGHLDLWLATQQPIPFGRLSLSNDVREAGIADPTLRWSRAALFRGGSLAYLTTRDVEDGEEIGVAAHGPAAEQLGGELLELTHTWHPGPRLHEPTITITRNGDDISLAVQW